MNLQKSTQFIVRLAFGVAKGLLAGLASIGIFNLIGSITGSEVVETFGDTAEDLLPVSTAVGAGYTILRSSKEPEPVADQRVMAHSVRSEGVVGETIVQKSL